MSDKPPFPTSGAYLKTIKETSKSLREASNIIISQDAIERLVKSPSFTSSFEHAITQAHGLQFPLKFSSHLDELNVISVLSLLNFGSGYRAALHAATGRGAWDNMRALVLALYLGSNIGEGDLLSAKGMQGIQLVQVAQLLRVDVHIERQHETLVGVTMGELGGPMYELVKLIMDIMNETGRLLVEYGYPNLGSFVLKALEEGRKTRTAERSELEIVLEQIVRAFPGFQDMAMVNGQPVYCFKKSLFLIHAITIRFGRLKPTPFPIPETKHSPVFADSVLPTMLLHLGVIDLTLSPLGKLLGKELEEIAVTKEEGYILRAAAIEGCEEISRATGRVETEVQMWLRGMARKEEHGRVVRMRERKTVHL